MKIERPRGLVVNRQVHGRRRADEARRVSDLLRQEIRESGSNWKLPSEEELIRCFSVSRNTIRDALDLLRHEGLLQRVTGAGTFASGGAARHRLDLSRDPNETLFGSDQMERLVLLVERRPCAAPLAMRLEIAPGDLTLLVEKIVRFRGAPLYYATDWFTTAVVDRVQSADLRLETSGILASLGVSLGEIEFSMSVVTASDADAQALAIDPGAPLVLLEMLVRQTDGTPIEWSFIRLRAGRLTIIPSLVSLGRARSANVATDLLHRIAVNQ